MVFRSTTFLNPSPLLVWRHTIRTVHSRSGFSLQPTCADPQRPVFPSEFCDPRTGVNIELSKNSCWTQQSVSAFSLSIIQCSNFDVASTNTLQTNWPFEFRIGFWHFVIVVEFWCHRFDIGSTFTNHVNESIKWMPIRNGNNYAFRKANLNQTTLSPTHILVLFNVDVRSTVLHINF